MNLLVIKKNPIISLISVTASHSDISAQLPKVVNCIKSVKEWSRLNGLMFYSIYKKHRNSSYSSRFRTHGSFLPMEIDGTQVLPGKRQEI